MMPRHTQVGRERGSMLLKILAAAVAVAIVIGAGAGLVISTSVGAGTARDRGTALLTSVGKDTDQVNSALQEPGFPEIASNASHPDFKGGKQRFDDYIALIDRTTRVTAADAAGLRSSDERLRG